MSEQPSAIPLTRRLVGQYLAFGLGCLLICLVGAVAIQARGKPDSLAPLLAIVSTLVLGVGAWAVHRTARMSAAVEQQLQRIARQSPGAELVVHPVAGRSAAADGWNRMIEHVVNHGGWERIEERIATAISTTHDSSFEDVFAQLPLGLAILNSAGAITHANRSLASLAGSAGEEELKGKTLPDALGIDDLPNGGEIRSQLKRCIGGSSVDVHLGDRLDDGVLRMTRYALSAEGGASSRQLWVVNDVTQQLLSAEARNQFVYTATHELRTPLTNLRAYSELLNLEDDIDVEKQKEFCNIINDEATRLARFVDDLLSISQMETGSLTIEKREADMEALVRDLVEHVQPEMVKKNLAFDVSLPAKWPKVKVDKDKIESALVNLLGNAAKYSPAGQSVSFEVLVEDANLVMHVEDTGIGIAEEELGRIFDTFFRSEDERVREISGSGLGLSFTRDVAQLHGGDLTVSSELNKGSRFTLTIPLS